MEKFHHIFESESEIKKIFLNFYQLTKLTATCII